MAANVPSNMDPIEIAIINCCQSDAIEENGKRKPGKFHVKLDYEPMNLMTTNLGIYDQGQTLELVELSDNSGFDSISLGVVLGYAMEYNDRRDRGEPGEKILGGIDRAASELAAGADAFDAASRGILTTDNGPKTMAAEMNCGGVSCQLAGMAKGAAMIGPNMATMLAVFLTDAAIGADDAQQALKDAVDESFNCISVEGHTSTNDTVLLFANGAAGGDPLVGDDLQSFRNKLSEGCLQLAKMIPDDGEGSSHLVKVEVLGAENDEGARQIACTVANSNLVKTGIAGCDPNWGRIISAVGYAGVPLQTARLGLELNGITLFKDGAPVPFDEQQAIESMRRSREVHIKLVLGAGPGRACFWTSDLTVDYVTFNSDYHT